MTPGWGALTSTERRIVGLVSEGLTNPEIAERMSISPRTVQGRLISIFRKVGVTSRTHLAAEAVRRDLQGRCAESAQNDPPHNAAPDGAQETTSAGRTENRKKEENRWSC